MKHLVILSFVLVHAFFGLELGYTSTLPVWKHLAFSFQHAGWMHLFINSVSFFYMFRLLQRFLPGWKIFCFAWGAAVTASFLHAYQMPVVGASAMIYAMIGMYALVLIENKVPFRGWRGGWIALASVTLSLTVSFFHAGSATILHLLSFGTGLCFYGFYSCVRTYIPNNYE